MLVQLLFPQCVNSCAVFPEQEPEDQDYFSKFVTLSTVRKSIHVGNLTFHSGSEVEKHLLQDVMKSIKPWLGVLMDNYRVRRCRTIVFLVHTEPPSSALCFCNWANDCNNPDFLLMAYSLQFIIIHCSVSLFVCRC